MTLEDLLNTLIKRGWKPFGMKDVFIDTWEWYDFEAWWIILKKEKGWTYTCESKYMPYRMLCTKSSWLWQFVCENWGHYQYRLIESALKDESELEEFLLNSIIIDD